MIRPARKEDRQQAAILMLDAIHDIANALTGEEGRDQVLDRLGKYFCEENNRLSYRNCLVKVVDDQPVGILVAYHGKDADNLDAPIRAFLKQVSGEEPVLDKEADESDYYIDTVSVNPEFGRRGYGSELLQAAIRQAGELGFGTVSLNVEQSNDKARRLYEKLGFIRKKDRMIHGHLYAYMVLDSKSKKLNDLRNREGEPIERK